LGVLIQAVHLAQKTDSNVVNSILNAQSNWISFPHLFFVGNYRARW
jgi:hypothetical protein